MFTGKINTKNGNKLGKCVARYARRNNLSVVWCGDVIKVNGCEIDTKALTITGFYRRVISLRYDIESTL